MIREVADTDGDGGTDVLAYGSPPDPYNDCATWLLPARLEGDVASAVWPLAVDVDGDRTGDWLSNGVASGSIDGVFELHTGGAAGGDPRHRFLTEFGSGVFVLEADGVVNALTLHAGTVRIVELRPGRRTWRCHRDTS